MNRKAEILKLLKSGKPPREIISLLGLKGGSTITECAKVLGLKFPRGRPFDSNLREQVHSLLSSGQRLRGKDINRILGRTVHGDVLIAARKLLGLPPPPRGLVAQKGIREKTMALKAAGLTYAEISKIIGVSRQRAQQYLRAELLTDFCEQCGAKSSLHAHHLSYSPPVVKTLCRSCHTKTHAKSRQTK